MAALKLYLDTRKDKKNGTFPLKIAVNHKERFLVNLGISIEAEQWDGSQVVNHPNRKILNSYIRQRFIAIENLILKLAASGELKSMSAKQLKEALNKENSPEAETGSEYTLQEHFEKFMHFKTNPSTRSVYQGTLNKLNEYTNKQPITFSEVNKKWLKAFEHYMTDGLKTNTRSIHLRNLRAIFNDAISDGFVSQGLYPFRKFQIKQEETEKRSLSIEELISLRDFECEKHQEKYRDLFMLIFYLIGINIKDLLNLREIKNGRIKYRRAKTGKLYDIEVPPEAKTIIDKYRGDKYLLYFIENYTNYRDFVHRLNENLQEIGPVEIQTKGKNHGKKTRTPLFPGLTTYYARHTWATIAASLDIPKETIGAALGHEIGSKITSIYIDFDTEKIDEANRKVMEYIRNYK